VSSPFDVVFVSILIEGCEKDRHVLLFTSLLIVPDGSNSREETLARMRTSSAGSRPYGIKISLLQKTCLCKPVWSSPSAGGHKGPFPSSASSPAPTF
jgi:hypothetical protein